MSTIATDGIHIAGDGQSTQGYRPTRYDSSKIDLRHGRIYAVAGLYAMREALIAWHHAGADPAKMPPTTDKDGWSLLVVDHDGTYVFMNEVPYPEATVLPYAIGSGRDWAVAAMKLGLGAEAAVRFACENDVYSGGEIQVVNIAEALRTPMQEAAE